MASRNMTAAGNKNPDRDGSVGTIENRNNNDSSENELRQQERLLEAVLNKHGDEEQGLASFAAGIRDENTPAHTSPIRRREPPTVEKAKAKDDNVDDNEEEEDLMAIVAARAQRAATDIAATKTEGVVAVAIPEDGCGHSGSKEQSHDLFWPQTGGDDDRISNIGGPPRQPPTTEQPALRRGRQPFSQPGAYAIAPVGSGDQQTLEIEPTLNDNGGAVDVDAVTQADDAASNNDNNDNGLVHANPVLEDASDDIDIGRADPVDPEAQHQKQQNRKREKKLFYAGLVTICVFAVIIAASVSRTLPKKDSTAVSTVTDAPTIENAHTTVPSFAPTSGILNRLFDSMPLGTQARIYMRDTPQFAAWEWLSVHPNLTNLPDWRKTQLFALACIHYALDGDNWIEPIKQSWLDDTKDECNWYSTSHGWVDDEGSFVLFDFIPDICNERGEYQLLRLSKVLETADSHPTLESSSALHLPPEIALLTSLKEVKFSGNPYNQTLPSFLPRELYHMENVTLLYIDDSHYHGSLPSELGLMTKLTRLDVDRNSLTGSIPSDLGLLTQMTELQFQQNRFSGTLPSEFGLLSGMERLNLRDNELVGMIPSELGMMTSTTQLYLSENGFEGQLPSELGLMTSLIIMDLSSGAPYGSLPSELGRFNNTLYASYANNNFTGTLSPEFCQWGCQMMESPFVGDDILDGYGSASLDQCECWEEEAHNNISPKSDIFINIRFDPYPLDVEWTFLELRSTNGTNDDWSLVDSGAGEWDFKYQIKSYRQSFVTRNSLYHFAATDSYGSGDCCGGMISITSGPSSVIWTSLKELFDRFIEVYVWLDFEGNAFVVSKEEGMELFLNYQNV